MRTLLLLLALTPAAYGYEPARFRPADVGLLYPDSQAIRCDPRTGGPANQYVAMARLEYLQGAIVPRVLRAVRDVCHASPAQLGTVVRDQMRKFHITYSFRPLCSGQPYAARANYLWDVPQGLLAQAQTCLRGKAVDPRVHPDVLEAASLAIVAGQHAAFVRLVAVLVVFLIRRREQGIEFGETQALLFHVGQHFWELAREDVVVGDEFRTPAAGGHGFEVGLEVFHVAGVGAADLVVG